MRLMNSHELMTVRGKVLPYFILEFTAFVALYALPCSSQLITAAGLQSNKLLHTFWHSLFCSTPKPTLKTTFMKRPPACKGHILQGYTFDVIEPAYKDHLCNRTSFCWSLWQSYTQVSCEDFQDLISCKSFFLSICSVLISKVTVFNYNIFNKHYNQTSINIVATRLPCRSKLLGCSWHT